MSANIFNVLGVKWVKNSFFCSKFIFQENSIDAKANIIIIAVLFIIDPLPRITYPVSNLTDDQFKQSNLHSLKANTYYLKLFQKKTYSEV